MKRGLLIVLTLLVCASASFAQTPDLIFVMLPNGNSNVQQTALSGTLSSGGITCTWSTESNSTTFTLVGNFTTSSIYPQVALTWIDTSPELEVAVTVTEPEAGTYDFDASVDTGSWETVIDENGLSGDWYYGHLFPANSRMDLFFELKDQSTDYNMTIVVEWGPGVPVEPGSWDQVKALYQ